MLIRKPSLKDKLEALTVLKEEVNTVEEEVKKEEEKVVKKKGRNKK